MIKFIGEAAMYEQLAEECAELAQAALKMARIIRWENPTPKTKEEAEADLTEEISDVILCLRELGLDASDSIIREKQARFADRWARSKSALTDGHII